MEVHTPQKLDILILYKDSRKTIGMLESEISHLEHQINEAQNTISQLCNKIEEQGIQIEKLKRMKNPEIKKEDFYKNLKSKLQKCNEDRKRLRMHIETLIKSGKTQIK